AGAARGDKRGAGGRRWTRGWRKSGDRLSEGGRRLCCRGGPASGARVRLPDLIERDGDVLRAGATGDLSAAALVIELESFDGRGLHDDGGFGEGQAEAGGQFAVAMKESGAVAVSGDLQRDGAGGDDVDGGFAGAD